MSENQLSQKLVMFNQAKKSELIGILGTKLGHKQHLIDPLKTFQIAKFAKLCHLQCEFFVFWNLFFFNWAY